MRMCYVMWGDAHQVEGETAVDGFKHGPLTTHCIGFVIRDDESGITLCQEWWDSHDFDGKVRNPTFIPKGMILLKEYLGD